MQNPTPLTVLIIEDNPRDFILLEKELLFTRIPIQSVRHINRLSDLAFALLQQKPDVIFLDLFLPDTNGNETLERVIALSPDIAIVIMSGRNDMNSALNALAAGAQDYLIKGEFDHKLLSKAILYSIERKKNQEMLRISNERLEVISDATNDMVWEWNLLTGEMYRNEIGFQKVYGYAFIGSPPPFEEWIESVYPEDRARIKDALNHILNSPSIKSYQEEFRYILPNGEIIYILDRGSILRNSHGKVTRIIGASQNITDRKKAELKLMASEHRFKSLVQNGSDLIGIITEQGIYCYVSPTSKHLLGFDAEYFIGKNAFDFIHPDDQQTTFEHLQTITHQYSVELPPFRFQHANGEWRWIRTKLTNMLNDPAVGGIVTTSWDITEARKIEEEMHRLSLVAKETVNGVVITDAHGLIIWVNSSFTRSTGFSLEESVGKRPGSFLQGPATQPQTVAYLSRQIRAAETFDCEIINYHKDGSRIWLQLQGQPIFNDKGELVQFFAIQTDITREKQATLETEKLKEQFRALIQNSFDVVEILNSNAKLIYVSPAVQRVFGYDPSEILDTSGFDYIHPEDKQLASERLQHLIAHPGQTDAINIRLLNREGQYRQCEILAKNLFNNAHIKGIVLNIRDVHDKMESEKELINNIDEKRRLEHKLLEEKLNRQKQVAAVSIKMQEKERELIGRELHDNVNQILASAKLYIEFASSGDELQREILEQGKDYILVAMNEIRKLSKSLVPPSIGDLDLETAIKELVESFTIIENLQLQVNINIQENTLNAVQKLNIYRVIQEQLSNIIKHAGANQVFISMQQDGAIVNLAISDNGVGFDQKEKKRGIGLKNIRARVRALDGKITISSAPGKGCNLVISFPLLSSQAGPIVENI